MADFATYALADARAIAKVADGTWIQAHSCRATTGGKIAVRVQRKMSPSAPGAGAWAEITSDSGE